MLPARLKQLRIHRELTQVQLEDSIGLVRASVSHYENGASDPDANVLIRLADFFGVTTDYLLGRSRFKCYAQEYKFRESLMSGLVDSVDGSEYIKNEAIHHRNEHIALMASVDKKYELIINNIVNRHSEHDELAVHNLVKLFKAIVYTGKIITKNECYEDTDNYIKFLNKLMGVHLCASDLGNIQANQRQMQDCTTIFRQFISQYICSIIDIDKVKERIKKAMDY